ncbi:MAG: heavy-metal-associated domain-containing protein [Candidatus Thorarchaeota archaeon]
MKTEKIQYKVSGMHCNGCAASIGKAVGRIEGIQKVEADFKKGLAVVEYDNKKVTKEKIIETIENLGYKVEGEA